MDQLIGVEPALTRAVYDQGADLLNLDVDLLFFDTTSTSFELDEADDLLWRDDKGTVVDADDPAAVKRAGFRSHGKSKDSRDDLPQVVVGMAVTPTGIPVRVWCWPGNVGSLGHGEGAVLGTDQGPAPRRTGGLDPPGIVG
jgi:hypothetical protein